MRLVPFQPTDAAVRRLTFIAPVSKEQSLEDRRTRQWSSPDSRERLFQGLDGKAIQVNGRSWQIRVYSICQEPGVWWLQLSLDGDPEYTVTMRTSAFQTAHDTMSRLSGWLSDPSLADETYATA